MASSIPARFKGQSLYDMFALDKSATTSDIKKAYRRVALNVHPDHNNNSDDSNADFAYVTQCYQILSDTNKRKLYDQTGSLSDVLENDSMNSESYETAYEFYRSMFPKITIDDIQSFKQKYINSTDERTDILDVWHKYEDIDCVVQSIPYADSTQVQRYIDIINKHSDVKCNMSTKQINAYIKKLQRSEKAESDELEADQKSDNDLVALIQNRQKQNAKQVDKFYDNLLDKYSEMETGKKKANKADPLDDDEFERIQREIDARRNKSNQSKNQENVDTSNKTSGSKRKRGTKG